MRLADIGCPICDSTSRDFICQNCVNSQDVSLPRQQKQQLKQCLAQADKLRQQKAEILQLLEEKLAAREAIKEQQLAVWKKAEALKAARAKAEQAKTALSQAQQQLDRLRAATANRRQVLDQLVQRTAATRTAVLGTELPNILRIQALTLSHVKAMLEREQRLRLRQLTEIFPLRINAVRNSGSPIQITICNLRLPDSGSTPSGGWPQPEATSAALGYLLLVVEQVGLIMGGPLLHESLYQGSTSSIWQPPGFWTRQPRDPAGVLPLSVLPSGSGAAAAAGQAAYNSSAGRYVQTPNFWGLTRMDSGGLGSTTAAAAAAAAASAATAAAAALSRAAGYESTPLYSSGSFSGGTAVAGSTTQLPSASSSGSSSTGQLAPGSSRAGKGPDFKAAWDLLQRSLACFLKDKAAKNGMQLPAAWNPVGWLVVYCAVVKRDMRQDGKLVALSTRATAAAAAAAQGSTAAGRQGEGGAGAAEAAALMAESSLGSMVVGAAGRATAGQEAPGPGWEYADDDEEDEGWVVQTPFLPPPPSQPDQVEHWVRAMYADPNALASSGQHAGSSQGYYSLGLPLPGRRGNMSISAGITLGSSPGNAGGMMSMERIRSLFSG